MLLSKPSTLALIALLATSLPATALSEGPAHARFFDRAFSPDFVATADDSLPGEPPRPVRIFFRVSELGELKVVSGRIVAADIFVSLESPAFSVAVPVGSFPVRLAVLQGALGRGRVAFARIDFESGPIARWDVALPEGHIRDIENPDLPWGYEVQSGTGAFFDPEAGTAALSLLADDDELLEAWLEEGQLNGLKERGSKGFRLLKPSGPANIAIFDAGWGDGHYVSWIGYTADGRVGALLTDFDVLDWSKVAE